MLISKDISGSGYDRLKHNAITVVDGRANLASTRYDLSACLNSLDTHGSHVVCDGMNEFGLNP